MQIYVRFFCFLLGQTYIGILPYTAIYLGEHPAVEVLVLLAIGRKAGTVLRVLLLPGQVRVKSGLSPGNPRL